MPIPKPIDGESHDEFMSRCMSHGTMGDEYPDEDQRYAVCQSSWDDNRMKQNRNVRTFVCDELRTSDTKAEKRQIVGHAAVFDSLSEDMWGFREKIAPGAFSETIAQDDIRALFNHNADFVLGRNRAGTLRLKEDAKGLAVEIDPPDTQYARDLMVSIERRDVTQMSFGFYTIADEWDYSDRDNPLRTLKKVRLFDVSPVTYPAYEMTDLELNDVEAKIAEWRKRHPILNGRRSAAAARASKLRQLRLIMLADGR